MTTATIDRSRPRRPVDAAEALARIETHEAVCALRWQQIMARIGRLETIIIGAAGTLIVGMAGIIMTVLLKGH